MILDWTIIESIKNQENKQIYIFILIYCAEWMKNNIITGLLLFLIASFHSLWCFYGYFRDLYEMFVNLDWLCLLWFMSCTEISATKPDKCLCHKLSISAQADAWRLKLQNRNPRQYIYPGLQIYFFIQEQADDERKIWLPNQNFWLPFLF